MLKLISANGLARLFSISLSCLIICHWFKTLQVRELPVNVCKLFINQTFTHLCLCYFYPASYLVLLIWTVRQGSVLDNRYFSTYMILYIIICGHRLASFVLPVLMVTLHTTILQCLHCATISNLSIVERWFLASKMHHKCLLRGRSSGGMMQCGARLAKRNNVSGTSLDSSLWESHTSLH